MFLSTIDLDALFKEFNSRKILIIGDVMIDSYFWGKVSRVSPEAPVPVVSDIQEETRLGGAANVALNIKAMGAAPILCGVIGDDDRGKKFLELMRNQDLTDLGIIVQKKRETTKKTRIISGAQHLLRVDEETSEYINASSEKHLLEFAVNLIENKRVNAVIIQDYDKGVATESLIKRILEVSNLNKIPVLVDPKKRNFLLYENVTLFKPNFNELSEGLKSDLDKNDLENIAGAMERLRKMKKHKMIMLTLSEMGIMINDKDIYHHISAETRDIADVSGAGDTVIGVASLCVSAGLSPLDIATLSNLAGGQVCEKAGVVAVSKEKLLEEAEMVRKEELNGTDPLV